MIHLGVSSGNGHICGQTLEELYGSSERAPSKLAWKPNGLSAPARFAHTLASSSPGEL
jgi:hypothetical protein